MNRGQRGRENKKKFCSLSFADCKLFQAMGVTLFLFHDMIIDNGMGMGMGDDMNLS